MHAKHQRSRRPVTRGKPPEPVPVLVSSMVLTAGVAGSGWLLGADRPTLMLIGILTLGMVALSEMRLAFAVLLLLAAQAVGEVIVTSEKIPPERVRRLEAMCTGRGIAVTRASLRIE